MKKYFVHLNDDSQGPFTLEELKDKTISRKTLIWFEGAKDWLPAEEIQELNELFKSIPPPVKKTTAPNSHLINNITSENVSEEKPKVPAPLSASKWNLAYAIIAVLFFVIVASSLYRNNQQNERISEQERIENERLSEAEMQRKAAELESLKIQLDEAVTKLRYSEERLEQVKQFQLLRTSSEKSSQIQEQLTVIRSWENEVARLKQEISKY